MKENTLPTHVQRMPTWLRLPVYYISLAVRRQDESQGNEIGGEINVEDVSLHKEVGPYCGSMYFCVWNEWLC